MENNEHNQILSMQVLSMVDQGCMLKLMDPDLLVAVGYAEMWLDRDMLFYCEMGNGETGHTHVLKFDTFDARSNQVLFYDREGAIVGGLAPYAEWPEVNTDDMQAAWEAWKRALATGALAACQATAQSWRHAELGSD